MTTATPMTPDEQYHLVGEATKLLLSQAPAGWERIIMDYMVIGKQLSAGASAKLTDGNVQRFMPPREMAPMLHSLRKGMYVQDEGTWFSMRLIIDPPDRFTIRYNRYDPPPFPQLPAREEFAAEQQFFPRSPEHTPEWFQRGLNG